MSQKENKSFKNVGKKLSMMNWDLGFLLKYSIFIIDSLIKFMLLITPVYFIISGKCVLSLMYISYVHTEQICYGMF